MIDHFNIKNFLVFEALEIPQLRRVNLIAGKNNVGKTALLEALRIYFAKGDNTVINNILSSRGLFQKGWNTTFDNLANRKGIKEFKNGNSNIELNELIFSKKYTKKPKAGGIKEVNKNTKLSETLYVKERIKEHRYKYDKIIGELDARIINDNPNDRVIYIPLRPHSDRLEELWDNVTLTPKEDDVLSILQKTVSPDLVRFDIGRNGVKVRLKEIEKPVPLKSLGDGLQRMLFIALSLANAQNSYLLIDEIEMGLHYSVMEKLWDLILKYSDKWNIQVFATTHSDDMIKSLYDILDKNNEKEVSYYRLQYSRSNKLEVITYDEERLKNSLDLSLEIR